MESSLFTNFALIIIAAALVCTLVRLLRQPPIIGYIVAGILVGPQGLNFVQNDPAITVFSQLGVAFLLFLVGIGFDPRAVREVAKVAFMSGLGQVALTWIVGLLVCLALGFSMIPAIYMSFAFTLSSTIIVMKLLGDKNEQETLHGRISMGILILQDLAALLAMLVVSSFGGGSLLVSLPRTLGVGILLVAVLVVLAMWVLPRVFGYFASSQELLFTCGLAWLLLVSALFNLAGFSLEMGALLAGIALSMSPYRYEVMAKVRPLRDFFVLIFFILLGSQIVVGTSASALAIAVFSIFILVGNPAIVFWILTRLGYTARTAFLTGLNMAQVSEFSFVLMGMGAQLGHVGTDHVSLVATVGLVTIAGSTYLVMNGDRIFRALSGVLSHFEIAKTIEGSWNPRLDQPPTIVLFGYNRIGHDLLKVFRSLTPNVLVVDYNPDVVKALSRQGMPCRYGDANDKELLEDLHLRKTRLACSTIPNEETNRLLIRFLRRLNKKAIVICVAHQIDEALRLYKEGASYVLLPHFLGGSFAARLVQKHGLAPHKFRSEKQHHIKHLAMRKRLGHEHPRIARNG